MDIFQDLIDVINKDNLISFFDINIVLIIYILVFIVLFLENAILPAFFLPGDSLLIFLGILISKGVLSFFITLGILTIAVSLGSWVSYLQGKFFKDKSILKYWLSRLPIQSYQKACNMLNKHGLLALFIGRFVAFIRTILPVIAGVSGLDSLKFQLFNWISSFIWVFVLIVIGFFVGHSKYLYTLYKSFL